MTTGKNWFVIRRAKGIGLAVAMVSATLLVPAQAAYAADGCGDGWYKESDGYLTKSNTWQPDTSRSYSVFHSGRVRFCTDNDPLNDDQNRKAIIGYGSTTDPYPFESMVTKEGNYAKFCVAQTIRAYMTGIKTEQAWGIEGKFSKSDPEVGFSYNETTKNLTVTVHSTHNCDADAKRIIADTDGITFTATDDSGEVQWVQLTTELDIVYWTGSDKHVVNSNLVEHDYST